MSILPKHSQQLAAQQDLSTAYQNQLGNSLVSGLGGSISNTGQVWNQAVSGTSTMSTKADRTRMQLTVSQITNGYLIEWYDLKKYETRQVYCKDLVDMAERLVGVYAANQMED